MAKRAALVALILVVLLITADPIVRCWATFGRWVPEHQVHPDTVFNALYFA